jgi:hypothetical protein
MTRAIRGGSAQNWYGSSRTDNEAPSIRVDFHSASFTEAAKTPERLRLETFVH